LFRIPYAVPPIGRRRFESAQSLDNIKYCWNGTLEAHKPTSECIQSNSDNRIEGSEDCLTLDIITPQVRNYNLLPVIVLIGSDSYLGGQPGILTPSARFARIRDVLYVRPKFRTNVMGYLALESISNSSRIPTSGNYALSDIIVALEWIQTNIHNFGGDPTSVILFGHRTGATLVMSLTSSSRANKLFQRAWASSPSAVLPELSLLELEEQNKPFADLFRECANKTCWQNQETSKLFEKIPQSWKRSFSNMLPKVGENHSSVHQFLGLDGVILKKHPIEVWSTMPIASKLVIGTTKHASYDIAEGTTISAEGIFQLVNDSKIGEANLTEEVLKRYGKYCRIFVFH
jgi:carboxylesterase type B